MNTRHGMSAGLVGLLLTTVAFAEAPVASQATDEVIVAASFPEHRAMEEIVVTARRPGAEPKGVAFTAQEPLDLLRDAPIEAPEIDALPIRSEIRLIF